MKLTCRGNRSTDTTMCEGTSENLEFPDAQLRI